VGDDVPVEARARAEIPPRDEKDPLDPDIRAGFLRAPQPDASVLEVVDIDIDREVGEIERQRRMPAGEVARHRRRVDASRGRPCADLIAPEGRGSVVKIIAEDGPRFGWS